MYKEFEDVEGDTNAVQIIAFETLKMFQMIIHPLLKVFYALQLGIVDV